MKKIFSSWGRNKKCAAVLAAMMAVSAITFTGCSAAENSSSSTPQAAAQSTVDTSKLSDARNTPTVRVAKEVGPVVVGITNKAVALDWFDNPVEKEGVGSGVIYKDNGYIITNNHVISGAKEIIVSLSDGRTFPGTVVGADEMTDLAVVKIDASGLPTAKLGDSDQTVVGEPAIAIGNPMGLEFQGSVTAGVISALNRTIDIGDRRLKLIQTDAAINPGNSGGALVNADGEVIGINSVKLAANGVEGMGFSIPINTVKTIVDEIMEKGYVARPYLGVAVFDAETAARYGYQLNLKKGVYVFRLVLGSPSDRAGLEHGDVILKIDDKEVNSVMDLRSVIAEHKVGDAVSGTYKRGSATPTAEVILDEMPQDNK